MPKIKLEPVPKHIVVPDTNILWDGDKKNPVSPDFDAFWERNTSLIPLGLVVPEVVLGELQFQQATSAIKCATTVKDQLLELSQIVQGKYDAPLDHQKIRKQVGDKLKKWVTKFGGSVEAPPVETIDWKKITHDAIWRIAPFTFDPKNKDNEKGFRDAMILETLVSICEKNKDKQTNIVFLCNDFLLRSSAETRLKHNKMLMAFESLPDFESYIKLTQQQLTDKFVKSIQSHARSKFFLAGDKSTFYYRENIRKLISEKFADALSLNAIKDPMQGLLAGIPTFKWEIIEEAWWISPARFDELVHPREYHWITRVTNARLLVGTPIGGGLTQALNPIREEIQLFKFDIKWKANVKADGRFHDLTLIDIVEAEHSQEQATPDLLAQWKLKQASSSAAPQIPVK